MLYGASPFNDNHFTLKPAMQLSAPIVSIKTLQAGDCVGYGASWSANQQTTIAIIAIGYGDGYPRHATNTMPVLINDALHLLAGRVSMDMVVIKSQQNLP
jgi:alanine racemase